MYSVKTNQSVSEKSEMDLIDNIIGKVRKNKSDQLVVNAIQTPDGTVLRSLHCHDYRAYQDANGKVYMIDGGLDYIKSSINEDQIHLTVTTADNAKHAQKIKNIILEAKKKGKYNPE